MKDCHYHNIYVYPTNNEEHLKSIQMKCDVYYCANGTCLAIESSFANVHMWSNFSILLIVGQTIELKLNNQTQ